MTTEIQAPAWNGEDARRPRAAGPGGRIPSLKQGDRMTGDEFERWHRVMSSVKRVELIEGVVHLPSPLLAVDHALPHSLVVAWLGAYAAATPAALMGDRAAVRLDADNVVQPDAMLMFADGGRGSSEGEGHVAGVPDLVVEVSSTGAAPGLYEKYQVYRRCGVREYLAWLVNDRRFEWWALRDGVYSLAIADERGVIASRYCPGLCLAVEALLRGDLAYVLAVLRTHQEAGRRREE
jgi:Uma2 family endonuclease